jgi:chromosome segregation protein
MRGAGMEDVIFAGTASRPPRDFAEVTILAERSDDTADSDSDAELEVTRRIERGAGSAYRSNGRDVRAKDVALIFADAATGAHSPALVSQGRIGAIISAKPQERRQMLEEAAGISGLHVRRKDAEQKLRAAESNLARLATILADMDARAGQLRRQAKQAERYRTLTKDILQAEARLIFVRWREVFSQAAAEFELQFGRHLRAQGQHRHRAWGVLQALQLLGALQLRPGLRQSLCRPKTSPWQQASKHRQGGRHAHGERNRWRKRCL